MNPLHPNTAPTVPHEEPTARDKDRELWERWHRSRSTADLEALMKQVAPLLRRETGKWANVAPLFLLENEAKRLALKAFESYDPAMGTQLNTHLINQLMKLSRYGYSRQSTLSVPEGHRVTFNKYVRVKSELEDQLGHPPTLDHIADHMGLPPSRLIGIVKNVERRELLESGEGPAFQALTDDDLIHLAYHDMAPLQQRIFELRTGYNGHSIKDGKGIMQELGISQGVLSGHLGKIKSKLEEMQKLR
jgi:DNA-directed RNA polymerase specialized sigma subunit